MLTNSRPEQPAVQNERVFKWWDFPPFLALTAINLVAVGYALWYWFSRGSWSDDIFAFVFLSVPILIGVAMFESRWLALPFMRQPRFMPVKEGWKVGVATTFVPGAEPIEMLEETLTALVAMEYPHDTWVLDEGNSDEVKALCEHLGVHHFSRKDMPQYQTETGRYERRTKHGNYNAWLYELGLDRYDLIVAFDPDHVPENKFLMRTLGYFSDPTIGYVQAAQVYYNQPASFIARGAAEETYAYYSSVQMTTYAFGYPIVTGCHNAHRSTALRDVGGFAPHDADDLLITIYYRAAGWRGVYLREKLALGLTPVDWRGYLKQQRRWARSVLDVKFRIFPKVAGELPRVERLVSFLHGLYYLHGLSGALGVLLLCYMLITGNTPSVFALSTVPAFFLLGLAFLACDFFRQRFYLEPRTELGLHWRAGVLRAAKWPWVLAALFDAITGRKEHYEITEKVRRKKRFTVVAPHLTVMGIIAAAWVIGMLRGTIDNDALHFGVAMVAGGSLAIALSELLPYPAPYDPAVARERLWPGEVRGLRGPRPALASAGSVGESRR